MPATLMLALALLPVPVGQSVSDPKLVRVFLHTDDGGHEEELAGRQESLKHLADALAKHKTLLVRVEKEELGDISIEVLERRLDVPRVIVGVGARPGQPPGMAGPARTVHLLVRLTWRDEDVAVQNKNRPLESQRGWQSAADDVADQLRKWIADHRARIVAARGVVASPQFAR